jgi:predicted  nucleic acid-binding Zn-ribbon protein
LEVFSRKEVEVNMLSGGLFEGLAAIAIAAAGGLIIIGQLKSNAERNAADIEAIKTMMHEFQEDMRELISKNLADVKQLIELNKENQRDALNREITHIKDMIAMTSSETREDIQRLESAQRESNKIKERLALAESSLRSLHRRLDIEPPINLHGDND